jgi:hypothetical protein
VDIKMIHDLAFCVLYEFMYAYVAPSLQQTYLR